MILKSNETNKALLDDIEKIKNDYKKLNQKLNE